MSLDTFQQLHKMLWGKKSLESSIIYEKTIDRLPSYNPNYPDSSITTYSVVDLSSCHTVHPIFPQDHSTILERSEYRDILLKLDNLDRKRRRYSGGVAVTGQPGIGKTFFLYYILIKRLLEGKCTVLQDRVPYFLFFGDAGCREIQITDTQHADLSDKPYAMRQTWILVDSNDAMEKPAQFATGRLCDAFVVQASSPWISRWKGWVKERGGRVSISFQNRKYNLNIWNPQHLEPSSTQIRDNPLSLDCLRRAFYYFGSVVRFCLMASEDDDEFMDALHSMEQAISEVEDFPRTIQDVKNQRASSHATHRIFLISANNTNQRLHYLVPQPRNFPVIDSLSISSAGQVILFQMTMPDRHPMLVAQLEKLQTCFPRANRPSALKPWNIVFVVPPEKAKTFRRQQLNPKDAPFHLRQYKLGLNTNTMVT
ncbi:hypothetical protein K439DRAFT_1617083 [Ramaria rubella]|nr:hypothetical protein K439DRAFT_1617083 [Ramaria rubella]